MKKQKYLSLLCAAVLALALAGCGGSGSASSTAAYAADYGSSNKAELSGFDGVAEAGAGSDSLPIADESRKIIYTARLSVESKTFDSARAALFQAAAEQNGYLESSEEYGSADDGSRSAYLTFRIPADNYRDFLNAAGEVGNVTGRSENTDDITASYVDVQARIDSLQAQRTRLEELRDQAETLEDLLTIESKLSDVQYQLESYTAQMRLYDDQVDYCTVSVSLDEVAVFTAAQSFGGRVADAFVDAWSGFVSFLQGLVIAVIYLLPYLILAGVIVLIVFFVSKRMPKKPRKASVPPAAAQPRAAQAEKPNAPGAAPGTLPGAKTPASYTEAYSQPPKDSAPQNGAQNGVQDEAQDEAQDKTK